MRARWPEGDRTPRFENGIASIPGRFASGPPSFPTRRASRLPRRAPRALAWLDAPVLLSAPTMIATAASDLPALAYARPRALEEALVELARPDACIYAGGTDLLPALRERRRWTDGFATIVDIKGLADARGISVRGDRLRIGALVTAAELAANVVIRRETPVLAEAALGTASPALRRRATVGGNVATPHPAGDVATALLALDAMVELMDDGTRGERPLADVMATSGDRWPRTRLLLAVHVAKRRRSAFVKLGTRSGFGRSIVAVAVALAGDRPEVALGGVQVRPFAARATAAAFAGGASLGAALAAECRPPADAHASAAYRLRVAETLIARAWQRAARP